MMFVTHDMARSRFTQGLALAAVSAVSFGLSGSFARGLLDAGWTPGAATLARVVIAAVVLVVPGMLALRGRWYIVARAWPVIVAYGLFAVAGAQLFYFFAVGHLDVGVALLIEYTSPVAVVLYLWARHGARPGPLTAVGAVIAASGLVLLLNVLSGASISLVGVGWALLAMCGASVYFIIGGDESNGLPPLTLAAGGLLVASAVLALAGLVGILPMRFAGGDVQFVQGAVPWWLAALLLGVVTAAVAYVSGIAATRRLGSRLGSFVALSEVLAAAVAAWLLLGQSMGPMQIGGAALVVAGVVCVKLGERAVATTNPEPLATEEPVPA